MAEEARINLNKPPFDLSRFWGRLRYFAWITDPRLSFVSQKKLLESKQLLQSYREKSEPAGTREQDVRRAQQLYLSAFHPDTGQMQNVFGRMSFYVPGGMILIGAMITFYRTNAAVIFWQWTNQSFNALVNYTNSGATSDVSTKRLLTAYVSATSCALIVALGLKRYLATRGGPLMQRLVPFAAVAAANAVNIPLMRQSELIDGVVLSDKNDEPVAQSKYAAVKGISQVTTARILMAAPSMTLLPVLMERLETTGLFRRTRGLSAVTQVLLSGLTLLVMVPVGCAIFPQQCSIKTEKLKLMDSSQLEKLRQTKGDNMPDTLYFNKGL
ncbi:sideroflexin-2-like [Babylonia areolata]|uniref:sideroflexin-2-like n=1 Tax=Babylonia areolata TaxID=304850 RepID=UPI003FD4CD44